MFMSQVQAFCRKMCISNRGLRVSANLHIIIGAFSMCFGIVEIGDDVEMYYHKVIPVPCLSILMGFWFLLTGIVGVLAGRYDARLFKVLVIVYCFFSMTSIICACLITACYYLTTKFWKYEDTHYPAPYAITWVITILGSVQIVVSLWAFVCSWTSIDLLCCCQSCNLEVRPQAELPIESNISSTVFTAGASNAFVLYGHDNVVIAEASGSNQNFSGTPDNLQIGNNTGNEEMPPSYETALQGSNFITEVTIVNTDSVGVPNEGLCGPPEIYQMRNEEMPPSYSETALQGSNFITEVTNVNTGSVGGPNEGLCGPPEIYQMRNEEMPPSYSETALQGSNFITEVTNVNTGSVGGPNEGLCGHPEIYQMRIEELQLPSYEMALQNNNSINYRMN